MSKNWPPDKNYMSYETFEKDVISNQEVLIGRVENGGDSLSFKIDGVYFEIHRMTRGKDGQRNMKVVAWMYDDNKYLKLNQGGNAQPITHKYWKFKVRTNGLSYMRQKRELIVIALSHMSFWKHDLIQGIFK